MADETRVVLIKPGDILLIGNLGDYFDPDAVRSAISDLGDRIGVKVYAFAADIDIAKIAEEDL